MVPLHRLHELLYHTGYLLHYVWVLDLAVINGGAAGAGERQDSAKAIMFNCQAANK